MPADGRRWPRLQPGQQFPERFGGNRVLADEDHGIARQQNHRLEIGYEVIAELVVRAVGDVGAEMADRDGVSIRAPRAPRVRPRANRPHRSRFRSADHLARGLVSWTPIRKGAAAIASVSTPAENGTTSVMAIRDRKILGGRSATKGSHSAKEQRTRIILRITPLTKKHITVFIARSQTGPAFLACPMSELRDEAIHASRCRPMDCFASLAITFHRASSITAWRSRSACGDRACA